MRMPGNTGAGLGKALRADLLVLFVLFALALVFAPRTHANVSECNASATLKFGGPLSLNESDLWYDTSSMFYDAYTFWAEWINSTKGGIQVGDTLHCVQLVFEPDYSDPQIAAETMDRMLSNGSVDFALAPYTSELTNATAIISDRYNTIMMAAGAGTEAVFEPRKYLFGVLSPAQEILGPILKSLMFRGAVRVAAFYEESTFQSAVCNSIDDVILSEDLTALNLTTAPKSVPSGADNATIDAVLQELDSQNPDVLIGCTFGDVCVRSIDIIANELYFSDTGAIVMTICESDFATLGDLAEYMLFYTQWSKDMDYTGEITGWTAQNFSDRYESRFGYQPPWLAAAAFAAPLALSYSIEQANTLDTDEIALELTRFDTTMFYGPLGFNKDLMNSEDVAYIQIDENVEEGIVTPDTISTAALAYPMVSFATRDCYAEYSEDSCICTDDGCPPCTYDDYGSHKLSGCRGDGVAEFEFFINTNNSCDVDTGVSVDDRDTIKCHFTPSDSGVGATISILIAFSCTMSLSSIIWTHTHRQRKTVVASQPVFLQSFACGAFILSLAPISLLFRPTIAWCVFKIWALSVGFSLLMGSLFVMCYRVWRIFSNDKLSKVKVRVKDVAKGLVLFVFIDIAVLGTWMFTVDTILVRRNTLVQHIAHFEKRECNYDSQLLFALLTFKIILAIVACYLAYRTRNVDKRFVQSQMIAVAVYNICVVGVMAFLVNALSKASVRSRALVEALAVTLAAAGAVAFVVAPKVVIAREEGEDVSSVLSSMRGNSGSRGASGGSALGSQRSRSGGESASRLNSHNDRRNNKSNSGDGTNSSSPSRPELTVQQYAELVFSPADLMEMIDKVSDLEEAVAGAEEKERLLSEQIDTLSTENQHLRHTVEALRSGTHPKGRTTAEQGGIQDGEGDTEMDATESDLRQSWFTNLFRRPSNRGSVPSRATSILSAEANLTELAARDEHRRESAPPEAMPAAVHTQRNPVLSDPQAQSGAVTTNATGRASSDELSS